MAVQCEKCEAHVAGHERYCSVCGTDAGFPNVRAAERPKEVESLKLRVETACQSARARGVEAELNSFESAVANSSAVMNRQFGALSNWLNSDSPLFQSFYKQIAAGRVPREDEWDQTREAAESLINPYYYRELSYAALTLDGIGISYYGPYSITLKDRTIDSRASVFEENPFEFAKKHHVTVSRPPPAGYRATWANRAAVGVAKLHSSIKSGMKGAEFSEILMSRRAESDCDFVEVHIYGDVNRAGIERVAGPMPKLGPDRLLWKQACRKLKELRAEVVELP